MPLTVLPIVSQRKHAKFDLFESVINSLKENKQSLVEGDVLVISSKFISNAQGRLIGLESVNISENGGAIAKKYKINPQIAEVILRESDVVFGGISGFVITISDNIMAPNAGIDKSNAKGSKVILYPVNPYLIAEQLRRKIFLKFCIHVGIIIVDSRLMPARIGTTGVAIACAGIEPVLDMRTQKDLDGKPLKVTFQAVVDNLASIANHKMGEAAESKPIVIVRDSDVRLTDRKINPSEMSIPHDQCVYVRGLQNALV